MTISSTFKKILILASFAILFSTSSAVGYSYWDLLEDTEQNTISIGEWRTPIATAQEFYDFATKTDSVAGDSYYLVNDIDFTNFTWNLDANNNNVIFRGTLDGDGYTISNLTIYSNSTTYKRIGIFPEINGGTVKNIVFDTVELSLGPDALNEKNFRSGIIAGEISGGGTPLVTNITLIDCGVRATRAAGAGGIVGYVNGTNTDLTITNIKETNLKVFNIKADSGGIVGQINKNTKQVTITDIDIQGEIYAYNIPSYTGGVVGKIEAGATVTISNAILETSAINTLETNSTYYNKYSRKYLGGVVGYNDTDSAKLNIDNVFFTGDLIVNYKTKAKYIGTAIGRNNDTYTMSDTYYSKVLFRRSDGSTSYTPESAYTGVFATLVNESTMPSVSWWNNFATGFDSNLWAQDGSTGRLYLIR